MTKVQPKEGQRKSIVKYRRNMAYYTHRRGHRAAEEALKNYHGSLAKLHEEEN